MGSEADISRAGHGPARRTAVLVEHGLDLIELDRDPKATERVRTEHHVGVPSGRRPDVLRQAGGPADDGDGDHHHLVLLDAHKVKEHRRLRDLGFHDVL
jgi:hypothetical protein